MSRDSASSRSKLDIIIAIKQIFPNFRPLGSTRETNEAPLVSKQIEGYFGMDLIILSRSQMARPTPELAPYCPNFRTTPTGGRLIPYA
ncbi:hypothetical protein AVEN_103129-1 [Araneus ventricosus]|uniref:Uncharacterized protein n=1 Tax=Araneus ventricosus TaxID=182803 RepID=A0A4Y2K2H2_ARAVE|nr:hypothetical protein AVEN_103129-1 [Araneus ventricosus]